MKSFKAGALLDSNVWRYVVNEKANGALLRGARDGHYDVLIAPAVLYEAFRFENPHLRQTLVGLMTHRAFRRLMPEAYSESIEIREEIKRLRPNWQRKKPNLQEFNRLEADWQRSTGGFWVRSRRWPEREARALISLEANMVVDAQMQAKIARREIKESDWKKNPPLDQIRAAFKQPVAGWRGDEFEAWRMDCLTSLTHSLRQPRDAYRDWLSPFIELNTGLLDSRDWAEFWIYDADKTRLPRQWLRWAFSFVQRFRKVSPGTPGDSQLSTHFLEADVVITADRILLEILEEIRPYAPCKLPAGHLISAGEAGVRSLLNRLNNV